MCAWNGDIATLEEVARELWKMAHEYRQKAAELDSGRLPYIGVPDEIEAASCGASTGCPGTDRGD